MTGIRSTIRLIRNNPIKSTACGATFATVGYASILEWRANSLEQQMQQQQQQQQQHPTSSSLSFRPASTITTPLLPREYDDATISNYWIHRPISLVSRVGGIAREITPLLCHYLYNHHVSKRNFTDDDEDSPPFAEEYAKTLKEALTRLGPAFVKAGQQLSIRPDLVPPAFLKELQKLCDEVEPVANEVALGLLKREWGVGSLDEVFEGGDVRLVASASLGQVYKAKLRDGGDTVAIKIQRPDMLRRVSLDLFLLGKMAVFMDVLTTTLTQQAPYHVDLVDTFARASYRELDYEYEAANQILFKNELAKRKCQVYVPKVYLQHTTRHILTTEWITGTKLSSAPSSQIRALIPVGVELFLTQLLDLGYFHADPHPGNLHVVTSCTNGQPQLCLLDFGLVATIDPRARAAMTRAIVHLLQGDFDTLIRQDAKMLGFLPEDLDTKELQPILQKILTEGLLEAKSDLRARRRKLGEISGELNEVFFKYPFSVPPFFALITRGLGLLEGIALSGDPEFDIFKASYPYARRRAIEMFGIQGLKELRRRNTFV